MAGDQVRALQDAERRRPRGDEAPADHLRARSRQPAALPQMRPRRAGVLPRPCYNWPGSHATLGPKPDRCAIFIMPISVLCRADAHSRGQRRNLGAACRHNQSASRNASSLSPWREWQGFAIARHSKNLFVRRLAIKSRLSPRCAWRGGRIFPWLRTGR
jgi:hypothetical protein